MVGDVVRIAPNVCERVARADAEVLVLAGAPHPWREFADVMPIGTEFRYELVFVTRSLREVQAEVGLARLEADSILRRLSQPDEPVIFEPSEERLGCYFVHPSGRCL